MLTKQAVVYNFGQGLGTKDNPVTTSKPLVLNNRQISKNNRLDKRPGYDLIPNTNIDGTTLSDFQNIQSCNDELIGYSKQNAYTFSSQLQKFFSIGNFYNITSKRDIVNSSNTAKQSPDIITLNGITAMVWVDNTDYASTYDQVYLKIFDSETMSRVKVNIGLGSRTLAPCLVAIGNYIFCIYIQYVGGNYYLKCLKFDSTNPYTAPTTATLATNVSTQYADYLNYQFTGLDVKSYNSQIFIIYQNTTPKFEILQIDLGMNVLKDQLTGVTVDATTKKSGAAIACTGNKIIAVMSKQVTTKRTLFEVYDIATWTLDHSGIVQFDPGCDTIAGEAFSATTCHFYCWVSTNGYTGGRCQAVSITIGGIQGYLMTGPSTNDIGGMYGLVSNPFVWNGYSYIVVSTLRFDYVASYTPGTCFLMRQDGLICGRFLPYESIYQPWKKSNINTISTNEFDFIVGDGSYLQYNKYQPRSINKIAFKFNDILNNKAIQANGLLFNGGSFLWQYDGNSYTEHNFLNFPDDAAPIVATKGSPTGNVIDGTYSYVGVYEWYNNKGQREQSAPSVAETFTMTGGGGSIAYYFPTLHLTLKRPDINTLNPNAKVFLVIYRTTSTDSSVFYRIGSDPYAPTYVGINNPAVDYVTISDDTSDADLVKNEILYTTGGILPSYAPVAPIALALFDNRLFAIDSENGNRLYYSNEISLGNPIYFSNDLYIDIENIGGKCKALGTIDEKLIIFKKEVPYYMAGKGPNNAGLNYAYSTPARLTMDIGCENPCSLVTFPDGLMFQSAKGIYLIDRGLNELYVGIDIELYGMDYVLSAFVVPAIREVRLLTASRTLVYSYIQKQWSTYSNLGKAACIFDNLYTYLKDETTILKENYSKWLDNTTEYTSEIVTPWFSFAQLKGYQRIFRADLIGEYRSPHKLNVAIGYDYNPNWDENRSIDVTALLSGKEATDSTQYNISSFTPSGTDNVYQFRINPARHKMESIRFKFTESNASGTNECYSLTGINFSVGVKKGSFKYGSNKALK